MGTIMRYDKYIANIEFDSEIEMFFGSISNLSSPITFYGKSTTELKKEFKKSIESYLKVCREKNIEPEKPFSGRFNIRLTPEKHSQLAQAAVAAGKSLNQWALDALDEAAKNI
ncbi:MAG: type II toxin-antitoxin system HicB family antitoxin [bacterium]|nr:type II toxin-antitoxin system HicB family antitoxin [bacterium]